VNPVLTTHNKTRAFGWSLVEGGWGVQAKVGLGQDGTMGRVKSRGGVQQVNYHGYHDVSGGVQFLYFVPRPRQ